MSDVALVKKKFVIVLHNSEKCPFDDVVDLLIYVLGFKKKSAIETVFEAHSNGTVVVQTGKKEILSQLLTEIDLFRKQRKMDVVLTIEPEAA